MIVMVVDDEKDVELLFRQHFRKEIQQKKFEFIFAFSGESALQKLPGLDQPLDALLILSDINMPDMNGLQLLQEVKKNFPSIRIMMITAYSDQHYDTAMEYGADGFYTKPLDFAILKNDLLKGQMNEPS